MATAQRTKNRVTIREGEVTTQVARPFTGLPEGAMASWQHNGRPTWRRPGYTMQAVRVRFKITQDQGMLADLGQRAFGNRSGRAVRGPAVADANGVRVNLDGIPALIRQAANASTFKATDGPLVATVKLLEQPEPVLAVCDACHLPAEAHILETEEHFGKWVREGRHGGHFDATIPNPWHWWYCPDQEVQA